MKNFLIIVLLCILSSCFATQDYLYRIIVNNRIGYIDKVGNSIIEPKYDYYVFPKFDWYRYYENESLYNILLFSKVPIFNYGDPFTEGIIIVKYKGKWGFINPKGNWVAEAKYDEAFPFKEGRAAVRIGNKWGYINRDGKLVIPLEYEEAYYFFENRAWVKKGGKYGFIDKAGKIIVPIQYDFYHEDMRSLALRKFYGFRDGMACVGVNGKFGYINTKGEIIIKPVYDKYWYFQSEHVLVEKNGLMGMMDKKGNYTIELKYFNIPYDYDPDNLIAFNYDEDGKIGFLNKKGEVVVKPKFTGIYWFTEGLAGAEMEVNGKKKWGFINNKGEFSIEPAYDRIEPFKNGTAIVFLYYYDENGEYAGKRTGCIDKTGKYVVPLIKEEIKGFYGDVAIVLDYDKYLYGLVDTNGNKIGETKYSYIGPFIDVIAEVMITNEKDEYFFGYINKQAEYVWKPTK